MTTVTIIKIIDHTIDVTIVITDTVVTPDEPIFIQFIN